MGQLPNWIMAIASVVMAIGVLLAWWQIRLAKLQATTRFEDDIAGEYRELIFRLPIEALLGKPLDEKEYLESLDELFHYIDLTNEEIFLRQQGRISRETWIYWLDGIKSNLSRPAFKKAWEEIKSQTDDIFLELRQLEASGFKADPLEWGKS